MESVQEASNQYEQAWLLFCDWAVAKGRNPFTTTPADLTPFLRQNPCAPSVARLRGRAIGIRRGWLDAAPAEPLGRAWHTADDNLLPLSDALARLPLSGWPHAFRASRDAFLMVLLAEARLTVGQVLTLTPDAFRWTPEGWTANSRLLSADATVAPAQCHACVVTRWLRAVGDHNLRGRYWVRDTLYSSPAPAIHHCHDETDAGDAWRVVAHLVPSIDQRGETQYALQAALTPRAITTILAARRSPDASFSVVVAAPTTPPPVAADSGDELTALDFDDLNDHADATFDQADAVNARVAAYLTEATAFVNSTGAARRPERPL